MIEDVDSSVGVLGVVAEALAKARRYKQAEGVACTIEDAPRRTFDLQTLANMLSV